MAIMNFAGAKILCVMAHPDDEVLGCGATLARAAVMGAEVRVLLGLKRTDVAERDCWEVVRQQFVAAVRHLGAFPLLPDDSLVEDTLFCSVNRCVELIVPYVDWCDVLFTHHEGDAHESHRLITRAVEIASRPFRRRRTIIQCEIPTSTDQSFKNSFSPNLFVSVDENDVTKKLEAMAMYDRELAHGRNPQNLRRLLQIRGEQIATHYAEAFIIARAFL